MSHSNTILHQMLTPDLRNLFARVVRKHDGDKGVRTLTCWNQFLAMLFAQVTGRLSLRDAAAGYNAGLRRLYHLGAAPVVYNTLAHANKKRPWEMYRGLAMELYGRCCAARPAQKRFRFKSKLFVLDATVISLCLSLYPWAKFRTRKGAVKMHTLLDWHGTLPAFAVLTEGNVHDVRAARLMPFEKDSITVMDRAYVDYALLYSIDRRDAYFVTRRKCNSKYKRVGRRTNNRAQGVLADWDIRITGTNAKKYPGALRLVRYRADDGHVYDFLTNRFDLAALTIADIYKARWDIELFFKWVKQHLRIKSYLGTTPNAVFTQIWIAVCAYLMLAWLKFHSKTRLSLSRMLSLIQLNIFSTRPLSELLHEKWKPPRPFLIPSCQLSLEGV